MDSEFVKYVVGDLLGAMPNIRAKAMFGGHGIYQGETIFAIIVDDELYYKVGDLNRPDFESHGSEPFRYTVKGKKPVTMSYWKLPAEIMDDRPALEEWTEKAIRVAQMAQRPQKRSQTINKRNT